MPSFTTVVEDCSPLLNYSGAWMTGSSRDDRMESYSQSNFMVSNKSGDKLTLQYQGTSVTIVGARRFNHGFYHAQVDSTPYPQTTGESVDPFFNQTLFTTQLEYGTHILTLTNDEDKFVDIDYVAFDTIVGLPDEPLIVNTYQDSHPAFSYSPSSSWLTTSQASWFSGSSGHQSSDSAAVAQLTFQGGAVALYGAVGPESSTTFSVTVDDGTPSVLSARRGQFRPQQLLFWAGNLTSGNHTLYIQPGTTAGALAIDYVNVYTTPSLGGSYDHVITQAITGNSTTSNSTSTTFQSHANVSRFIPTSFIVALALSSAIAVFLIICMAALLWKYRPVIFSGGKRGSIQSITQVRPYLPHLRTTPGRSAIGQSPATSIFPHTASGLSYVLQCVDTPPASSYGLVTPVYLDLARTPYSSSAHVYGSSHHAQHSSSSFEHFVDPSRPNSVYHGEDAKRRLTSSRSLSSLRERATAISPAPPVPPVPPGLRSLDSSRSPSLDVGPSNAAAAPPQYTPTSGRPYLHAD